MKKKTYLYCKAVKSQLLIGHFHTSPHLILRICHFYFTDQYSYAHVSQK